MTRFYTAGLAEGLKKRARGSLIAATALHAAAWIACVALCTRVRTGNAGRLLGWTIGLFTVGGWAAILLLALVHFPAKARLHHTEGMLAGEKQERRGRLAVSPTPFHIPKSITIYRATLEEDGESLPLNILFENRRMLPPDGTPLRLETVRGYITACEVEHEVD